MLPRFILLLLLCSATAVTRAEDFPIKKFAAFTWTVDYEPFWSPDGRQIVLVSSRHGGMKIHLLKADSKTNGSDMRQLTFGNDEDDTPAWSPDGKKIAFVSIRSEVSQLFVMNAGGTGDRNISGEATLDGWPAWSHDGRRVIFSRRINDRFQLFVMNRDGTGIQQLTDAAGEFVNPRWSPDGSKILCARRLGDMNLVIFPAPPGPARDH
jgi:TolB protein